MWQKRFLRAETFQIIKMYRLMAECETKDILEVLLIPTPLDVEAGLGMKRKDVAANSLLNIKGNLRKKPCNIYLEEEMPELSRYLGRFLRSVNNNCPIISHSDFSFLLLSAEEASSSNFLSKIIFGGAGNFLVRKGQEGDRLRGCKDSWICQWSFPPLDVTRGSLPFLEHFTWFSGLPGFLETGLQDFVKTEKDPFVEGSFQIWTVRW